MNYQQRKARKADYRHIMVQNGLCSSGCGADLSPRSRVFCARHLEQAGQHRSRTWRSRLKGKHRWITDDEVAQIRALASGGMRGAAIAQLMGRPYASVQAVIKGKTHRRPRPGTYPRPPEPGK